MWREVRINDGDPDLVQRAYDQLSPEPFGPWAAPLNMEKFHLLETPRSFLVGVDDLVMPPGDSGWHPRMSSRLGNSGWCRCQEATSSLYQSNRPC
jgi:hypothetical protein